MNLSRYLIALTLGVGCVLTPAAASYLERPEVREFIDEVAAKHQLNKAELRGLFGKVQKQQKVLDAIARPYEAKPWKDYRPIFVTEKRIDEGVEFWKKHRDLLSRVATRYGVPEPILLAIVGVETRYGRYGGGYLALDTLTTLAFDYPPRSKFFRSELESYLLLARDEQLDPRILKGSYAAAMGMPQFISSSYRHYAVDGDGDGRRDLFNNLEDVFASVANYFVRHRWQTGEPVVMAATPAGEAYRELLSEGLKPDRDPASLRAAGIDVPADVEGELTLLELEGAEGPEVWLGYPNFYVITRYNRSALYALAVYQLSEGIRVRGREQIAGLEEQR